MQIAIQPDQGAGESYSSKWTEILREKGIGIKSVDITKPDFLDQLKDCNGLMWRWLHTPKDKLIAKRILYLIEQYLNVPVYPDFKTCWHFDDKVAQHYLFATLNIPTVDTWVFWNRKEAVQWAETTSYPKIFKLSAGAGASNVLKVNSKAEAMVLIDKMFIRGIFSMTMNEYGKKFVHRRREKIRDLIERGKEAVRFVLKGEYPSLPSCWWQPEKEYAYFQEFIAENSFDTRVTVIGNRAFAFRRFNRENDFRASGSGNIDWNQTQINKECIKIAFETSKKLDVQSMAYDFLYKEGKPIIIEMSYTYADWAIEKCPGHWDQDFNWVSGQMWPQEAQVEDFIQYIKDNKQHEHSVSHS